MPQSLCVAVPSRIYTAFVGESPIRGKRIRVKDLFALHGLRMALSTSAYYSISPPAQANAPALQKLIDADVVVGGSTKCSSMISREDPVEAVDFQAPFTQEETGINHLLVVAAAALRLSLLTVGWTSPLAPIVRLAAPFISPARLKIALASDSSRRRAFVNGCFQTRFSHAALSLEGVRPCFS